MNADLRSRHRKARDNRLILTYSVRQYRAALLRKATEAGVDPRQVRNAKGHREAIREGFMAMERWFNGLPGQMQAAMRQKIRDELASGVLSGVPDVEQAPPDVEAEAGEVAP